MDKELHTIKIGLALVLAGLLFGAGMGIFFGINEGLTRIILLKG